MDILEILMKKLKYLTENDDTFSWRMDRFKDFPSKYVLFVMINDKKLENVDIEDFVDKRYKLIKRNKTFNKLKKNI